MAIFQAEFLFGLLNFHLALSSAAVVTVLGRASPWQPEECYCRLQHTFPSHKCLLPSGETTLHFQLNSCAGGNAGVSPNNWQQPCCSLYLIAVKNLTSQQQPADSWHYYDKAAY